MYYYNEVITDVEDLVLDFLVYRKNKRPPSYKMQSQLDMAKGWPSYRNVELLEIGKEFLSKDNANISKELESAEVSTPAPMPETKEISAASPALEACLTEFMADGMLPPPINGHIEDTENEYMELLFSEINKKIHPYVDEVLNQYEYEGSPVYDEHVDKETIAQMVDKVIELMSHDVGEAKDISFEMERNTWNRNRLLRSLTESHLIYILYFRRRPMYRNLYKDGWKYNLYL